MSAPASRAMRSLICAPRAASRSASQGFFSSRDQRRTTLPLFWSFAATIAPGHRQRARVVHRHVKLRGAQVHIPAGGAADDEPNSPAHPERGYANAATHTRIEGLRRDLRAPQHDKCVNRFKRNPLTALGRRHHQGAPAMPHAGTMIPHIDGAQIAHRKTMLSMYRFTLRGALDSSGRQWCRSWHSLHRASLGASGNSNLSS